ncbi:cell division cycle 7-related protein kinase [Anaeramoeba flamelloides]|uniref:non-specific serine/threonine protein kinase n=1 Tax=Anaeramoeba flamelloides TaxID=1746091 RepID=A0ABQ8XRU5_9EUKA|nr:cell division cycle 7-related protein kinase [Anaeramoeba flamelloides]
MSKKKKSKIKKFVELKKQFDQIERIGQGTFSRVFRAREISTGRIVALKRIFPTSSPTKILREMEIIHKIRGSDTVCALLGGCRHEDQITLIMTYFQTDDFKDFFHEINVKQIAQYMVALLRSLAHVHSKNIVHRDVKPGNFLYCVETGKGMLIDFGLAQYVSDIELIEKTQKEQIKKMKKTIQQERENNQGSNSRDKRRDRRLPLRAPRAGTRGFRSPEILFKSTKQTTSIDIWSAGVMLLSFLSGRYPFFHPDDDLTALAELIALFGTKRIEKIGKMLDRNLYYDKEQKGVPLKKLCKTNNLNFNEMNIPNSAFDLLERLLEVDYRKRITAEEALKHPFCQLAFGED